MTISNFFKNNNWNIVHQEIKPEKEGETFSVNDLNLSTLSKNYLSKYFPLGIYKHQKIAIQKFILGAEICLSTSTSSGKTLVFHICVLETLAKNPSAKTLTVYPTKALTKEQRERWDRTLSSFTDKSFSCGKIDGDTPKNDRIRILEENQVICVTPDIIHSWILYSKTLKNTKVQNFLKNLSIVILDEAHTYSGVFGSNSAFLFRRLTDIVNKLNGKFRYIAASATMENPSVHLNNLTGRKNFNIIDSKNDTSAKHEVKTLMVELPIEKNFIAELQKLIEHLIKNTSENFITFVDSRKKAELFKSFMDDNDTILSYRAGYEDKDRDSIQNQLTQGALRGVISTSALEMGIDIPHLTMAILIGVPASMTSYYQRIGRVGRSKSGTVIIINDFSIKSQNVFAKPENINKLPLTQSNLYLDNKYIQYIHAMCLSRIDGEHDVITKSKETDEFWTNVDFPQDFKQLCFDERIQNISQDLRSHKNTANDSPNLAFPLRDNDSQYQLKLYTPREIENKGTLTKAQIMREAYPGAIHMYQGKNYRVTKVNDNDRSVELNLADKFISTNPEMSTRIYPQNSDLQNPRIYSEMVVSELELNINEYITGYTEQRGASKEKNSYPNQYYHKEKYSRNYPTTGIIISHFVFNQREVKTHLIAKLILEAYIIFTAKEKQDINFGIDRFIYNRTIEKKGNNFIAIYDNAYGSLRLTKNLMEHETLSNVILKALEWAESGMNLEEELNEETIEAIKVLSECINKPFVTHENCISSEIIPENCEKLIKPESIGRNISNNQEVRIDSIAFLPTIQGLVYKCTNLNNNEKITLKVDFVEEIFGVSNIGFYDMNNAEFIN